MNKIEFLESKFSSPLLEKGFNFQDILEFDPTENKKYLNWVVHRIIAGKIEKEDTYKIPDLLGKFHRAKIKKQLPVDKRNIHTFEGLPDLYNVTSQIQRTKSDISEEEKDNAYLNSEILYKSEKVMAVVPLTKEASCFWGKGTNWCTAATSSNNLFHNYYKDGHKLIVIILDDGRKFQGYTKGGFADSSDRMGKLSKEYISVFKRYFLGIPELEKIALSLDGELLKEFSSPSEEYKMIAVRQHPNIIRKIKSPSDEMIKVALGSNGLLLEVFPDTSRENQEIAIRKSPLAIEFVKNPDVSLFELAITRDAAAIKFLA